MYNRVFRENKWYQKNLYFWNDSQQYMHSWCTFMWISFQHSTSIWFSENLLLSSSNSPVCRTRNPLVTLAHQIALNRCYFQIFMSFFFTISCSLCPFISIIWFYPLNRMITFITPTPEWNSNLTHNNLLFFFPDSCLGHTDKFHQSPSESGPVRCICCCPQDPTNSQYVEEG